MYQARGNDTTFNPVRSRFELWREGEALVTFSCFESRATKSALSKCFAFFMTRWICLAIFHKN